MKGVERIYPDDKRHNGKTYIHHLARYELAKIVNSKKNGLGLDLACGTGYGTNLLRENLKMVGVDICKEAIEYARNKYPDCEFIEADIVKFDFGKKDLITFFEGLEHLSKKEGEKVLFKASEALNSSGAFIMSIPRSINEKDNSFHKSHWSFNQIKARLETKFKSVIIVGQDWDTAEFSDVDVENNDFYIAICRND